MQSADDVGEALQGADEPVKAGDLAKELGRLRQRGLAYVDNQRQGPLVVPLLDASARRHTANSRLSRVEQFRRLLQDGLQAFEEAGSKEDAEFVRLLFFGARRSTALSRERPGVLLATVRKDSKLSDDNFDDRRREVFLSFADFLLGFVPAVPEERTDPDTQDKTQTRLEADNSTPSPLLPMAEALDQGPARPVENKRSVPLLAWVVGGVILIAGVIWTILQLQDSGKPEQPGRPSTSAPNPSNSPGPTASSPERPLLTFDDLGGGSSIISVYPGVKDTPEDKQSNGTFQDGNTASAICKVNGRLVTSNTAEGERPKKSSTWIQVAGSPGIKQYAPLTYVAIEQGQLDALPNCPDAP